MSTRPPLAILPVAIAIIQLVGTHFAAARMGVPVPPVALVLLLAGPALLFLRRRASGPMAAASAAVAIGYLAAGFPAGPFVLSLVIALVLAVIAGARWWAWGAAAGFALGIWLLAAHGQARFFVLAWLAVILLAGELVRAGRLRRAERHRAEAEQRKHQQDEERLVLARDIHDVVAHSLSMINVQASVALHLEAKDSDPAKLREALSNIKAGSATALSEVREVLSVLRHDAPRMPSQRLEQLPELIAQATTLDVDYAPPEQMPAWVEERVENTIYRVVQESLTNIVRHAKASRAVLSVQLAADQTIICVADDGIGMEFAEEGNGLRGLRERVEALGGTVLIKAAELPGAARPGTLMTARIPAPQATMDPQVKS